MASPLIRPRSLDALRDLIAFPTITRQSNLSLIDHVRERLAAHGIAATIVPDESGSKANLFASVGPQDRPGVLLSGHTDVVPVEGQAWTVPPFQAVEREGRLYGRGSADMKGFVACAVQAMIDATALPLSRPLQLALSYDEEIGCIGVRRLLDVLETAPTRPYVCLIGEPTGMHLATGHKGKTAVHVSCHGLEAHSALAPQAVNALHLACDFIGEVRLLQQTLASDGARDAAYSVPYTTLHVGTLQGGKALNIVPNHCELDFEIRNLPADDPCLLLERLRDAADRIASEARVRHAGSRIELAVSNSYPGLETALDDQALAFVAAFAPHAETTKLAFGTEGGLFGERLSVPVVVCGPGHIEHAHKPDEYVALEQLVQCERFLADLLGQLCA